MTKTNNLMYVANDLGYGSVKACIDGENVHFPSVMATQRQQDLFDPVRFSNKIEEDAYMEHILDKMDITIQSASVKTQGRFLVGRAAVESHLPLKNFDVNDLNGKCDTDLSLILTLGMIASARVKKAYFNAEDLTKQLDVNVFLTTALPVLEGKRDNVIDTYARRFSSVDHVVTLHNFDNPIVVRIHFDNVIVALEGETAQYALRNANADLKKRMKATFDQDYPSMASEVSEDMLVSVPNVLGIDIGEGTTDLIVFNDDKVNIHASTSLQLGYGNSLEDAIELLQAKQFNIRTRADLQEFINQTPNAFNKSKIEYVKSIINEQLDVFVNAIVQAVSQTLNKASSSVDVVYVYGGGAVPMYQNSNLASELRSKVNSFNAIMDVPVIWIGKEDSQFLNRDGLKVILNKIAGLDK